MEKLSLTTTSADPVVELVIEGDLRVKGQSDLEVTVKTDSVEDTVLEQTDTAVRVVCPDDCKVLVPRDAKLHLVKVAGDVVIKAVEGDLEIDQVDGSLKLRSVGNSSVTLVSGNLEGKNIMGSLSVKAVEKNLVVRDVQDDFSAQEVSGNLVLDDIDGNFDVRAEGNVTLRWDPAPNTESKVFSEGNLICSLPADASVEIEIVEAGQVQINFPGIPEERIQEFPYTLTLGDGDARLRIEAEGQVSINTQAPDWTFMPDFNFVYESGSAGEAYAEQVTRQIESQVQDFERQLNSHLSNLDATLGAAGFSPERINRFQERAREASQRVSGRVQEKIEKAQERLERKLAQAQRTAERHARHAETRAKASAERAQRRERRVWRTSWQGSEASEGVHDPVSDDERLLILKMLQEKKITKEDAESLLAALEGKEKN